MVGSTLATPSLIESKTTELTVPEITFTEAVNIPVDSKAMFCVEGRRETEHCPGVVPPPPSSPPPTQEVPQEGSGLEQLTPQGFSILSQLVVILIGRWHGLHPN